MISLDCSTSYCLIYCSSMPYGMLLDSPVSQRFAFNLKIILRKVLLYSVETEKCRGDSRKWEGDAS